MAAPVIDLTGLTAAQGLIIQGDAAGDFAGWSVSSAGDINGDGFADLIVGAPRGDDGGDYAGEAYVIFGKTGATRANIDLTSLAASDGFIIQGDTAGDGAGYSVTSAGDINGDGFTDLLVGAPSVNDSTGGKAYVIFGKVGAIRTNIDLTSLAASDGFIIQSFLARDYAGYSVSSAGDINGDGFADLIVGAYRGDYGGIDAGEAYVIFGKAGATRANIGLPSLAPSDGFIILGDDAGDRAGFSVSSAGDINGDGFADLIVGALRGDNGGIDAGEAYVIFGKAGATRTSIDLTSLAASDGFIIQGDAADDRAGFSVSSAGDINGDGFADLIVGAPGGDNGGIDAGEAYVIFGRAGANRTNIDLTTLAASDGFIIVGDDTGDRAGGSVSSAGDINGDGFADLIVGASRGDNGGIDAGEAYVIFGKAGATRANIDLTALAASDGFIIQGDAAGDWAGLSVASAGDINGDGFADLIVGAPYGDNGGTNAGEAYVIYGSANIGRVNQAPTAAPVTLTAIAEDSGARTITAAELLAGAADADGNALSISAFTLTSGNGTLVSNGDGTWSYTPAANDDTAAAFAYTVSDGSLTASSTANFDITPVGDAPVITSNGGLDTAAVSVAENSTVVTTVTSTDVDAGATKAFSISGGADAARFQIDAATGALSFRSAPNFEARVDAGTNNIYDVIVSASDGTLADTQAIAVTVTNVNEAPVITSNGGGPTAAFSITENTTAVTTVQATDPDASTVLTYAISGADAARFQINAATGALSFRSAPNFEAPVDVGGNNVYDVTVSASDGTLNDTQAIAVTITDVVEIIRRVRNDFNGDGRSDLLWRNSNGQLSSWLGSGNGALIDNGAVVNQFVPTSWRIQGTADFNGDGRADVLWRNVNGQLSNWLGTANGGLADNGAVVNQRVSLDWKIAGTGDFNGDGRSDIIWRNDNGRLSSWIGTANGGLSDNFANVNQFVATSWKIAGTGDFNGDGRDDLIWRNDNGQFSQWLGTASGGFTDNGVVAGQFVPTAWKIAGTGDFNGDGFADVLWRNDNGQLSEWTGSASGKLNDNGGVVNQFVPNAWKIAGTGDFNGDGRADIAWRNVSGQLSEWLGTANGGFTDNGAVVNQTVPNAWTIYIQDYQLI